MKPITELRRLPSPAPKPQSLAWDGKVLWMGSRQTKEIFAIDPAAWKVLWQTTAPGVPYGMTAVNGELRVICSETADDNRFVRRLIPYRGFDSAWGIQCPDDTGSQLGWDGQRLNVSQWYPKKVIAIDEKGAAVRVIAAPHGICGQVWVGSQLYLASTDAEETLDYFLTKIDPGTTPPTAQDIAHIPFAARALAFDGTHFWTNHREQNEIVCFSAPGN
jgi:outer membrane protein assembly factor BamB